jgi:PAS domain S-box-containing protein
MFALGIASLYLLMVYGVRGLYPADLLSATVRFYMFVLVGVVISYLSLRIKKEEQKYHRIFEQSYTGILLLDPASHAVMQANQHMEDILGYAPEELNGMQLFSFFNADDLRLLVRSFRDVVTNPVIQQSHEFPARKKDGTEIQVSLSVSGIPDERGACEYIVLLVQDITGRRHAENVIRQQAAAMRTSSDGMAILNNSGKVHYVNDAFCRIFEYTDSRIVHNLTLDHFFTEGEWKRFDEEILPVLKREGQWRGEMTGKRGNTATFPLEISLGLIEGEGIFCIVHDISERKQKEQALRQVTRKLNFLSNITRHDISNQVFSILGFLHIAKELGKGMTVYPYLEKMEGAIRVINERIEFTSNYRDMGMSDPAWQDLNLVFQYAISHLDLGRLTRKTSLEGVKIFADPMLENALFNLVKNTLLHAKTATEIRFIWKESPWGIILVYEDNGPGILSDDKERIFASDTRSYGGFGLFFVREILAITGMTIVETGVYGSGARFEITVPKGSYRFTDSIRPGTSPLTSPAPEGITQGTDEDRTGELP